MKSNTFYALIVLLFIGSGTSSNAQETQVPIDEVGKTEYIDAKLERMLGLFTDYQNFRGARLFQISDTTFVLEISYRPQEKLLKVRLPLSAEETENFRRKVTKRIEQQAPHVVLNQEGRARLLVGTAILSLGYYGWAVPAALDVDNTKSAVALYMLTSSGGFFIPFLITKGVPVPDAAATLSLYGGTRGIVHGIMVNRLLQGKETTDREDIASGMLGSISEAIFGYYIARGSRMSNGAATTIGVGGDFGLGLGIGSADLAGFFDDDNDRSAAGSMLLGSGLGLLAGTLLANNQPYTRGDARVLRAAGFLGAYVPLAVVDIAGEEDEKVYTAASMLGSVIGLGLGHHLVRGQDFTAGQGSLIALGELAGGLLGLGFAYLVSSEDDNDALYLTSSSLGATGGFWLIYRAFAQGARETDKSSAWNINVRPEGLAALAMGQETNPAFRTPVPLLTLDITF